MAPPQEWAPNQRITALAAFLSDYLFLYVLSFSFSLFFFPAVFCSSGPQMSHPQPGARVAAAETFQSSHLIIKALFVGVGVRTSLSPVLSPPLKAQEGIVGQREWQEHKTGGRIFFSSAGWLALFFRRWITWRVTGVVSVFRENNERRGAILMHRNTSVLKFR